MREDCSIVATKHPIEAFGNRLLPAQGHDIVQLRMSYQRFVNYNYVIASRGQAALIDPAWEPDTILATLANLGLRAVAILLTHSHMDHVDLADYLAVGLRIPVYMHKREIDAYGFRCANLQPLQDDQEIRIGEVDVRTIATPGHTSGSVCFHSPGALFAGDTLFNEGCGVCHVEGGDPHAMYRSLTSLLSTLDPSTRVFPGHSFGSPPGMTLEKIRQMNVYLQFRDPNSFSKFRMRADTSTAMDFV